MENEYIIINKTSIQKRIEEWETELQECAKTGFGEFDSNYVSKLEQAIATARDFLSLSTPLIPDIKDIQIWLSKQSYQKEYGEQEYMMYYDVDVPKIIQDYISNLKLDI